LRTQRRKTLLLQNIAQSIAAIIQKCVLNWCCLIDERPEEVTENCKRLVRGEVMLQRLEKPSQ